MSKLSPRMLLLAALVLILIAGAFTTYKVASANSGDKSVGTYVLTGGLVNQLKPQQTTGETQNQVSPFPGSSGEGGHGGCESENKINPSDL